MCLAKEVLQVEIAALLLSALTLLGVVVLLIKNAGSDSSAVKETLASLAKQQEVTERLVREDVAACRREIADSARQNREELSQGLKAFGDSLNRQVAEMSLLQKTQLDLLTRQLEEKLAKLQAQVNSDAAQNRAEITAVLQAFGENFRTNVRDFNELQRQKFGELAGQLEKLVQSSEDRLEKIRATVEEKLQNTLEKRLGESFRQVSERLEQVHKGLGEMQTLAAGVGDLKKALTNVKIRGTLGEIQLENILEQILSPDQYEKNVAVKPNSRERVEYAVKMPGRDDEQPVWLPIDAKFPLEDYHRLLDAYDAADAGQIESSARQLENSVKKCAKDIRDKYLSPPHTTDFAIMFLPFEGLYAEVLRRAGLFEALMRDYKVAVTGPTTLAAFLNSLQMGFRTLTIEKRTSEVWQLLGAVRTQFSQFGALLEKTKKKLEEASNTIDGAARKSRTIERKLDEVQKLPEGDAGLLLDLGAEAGAEEDAS
ncbi:MAG: DNA recombination protein RmuC [Firmicutes bacterium]|nr:DNA recombination protein RmuC [Bacillota bacterium]